jgi:hypothetical protein
MTRLSVAIAVARPGMIVKCLELLVQHATKLSAVDLLLFGNGLSEAELRAHIGEECLTGWHRVAIESHPTNEGVPFALHRLWQMAQRYAVDDGVAPQDNAIAYLHDDAFISGDGWDVETTGVFEREPRCGLAGYSGALGLGLDRLYDRPYDITNLIRMTFISNLRQAEAHGRRVLSVERVAVNDGYSLIVRQTLLDQIGGWEWWPFPHHNYDTAIACQCARAGMHNYYIPVASDHLSGFTANNTEGATLLRERGGEAAIHHASAKFLYDNFRDVLPLRVR